MELDRSYIESKLVFYPAFEITWHQEWALLAITVCWLVGKLLFLIALSLYPFPFRVNIDSSPNKIVQMAHGYNDLLNCTPSFSTLETLAQNESIG